VGHPFLSLNQTNTLTYIKSICSTSLEPKSQLSINLALKRKQKRRKFPIKRIGKKQKEKIPNQGKWEKAKKKENSRSKIGREKKKYAKRS